MSLMESSIQGDDFRFIYGAEKSVVFLDTLSEVFLYRIFYFHKIQISSILQGKHFLLGKIS